jgi:sarcosine oxidase subunit gamma
VQTQDNGPERRSALAHLAKTADRSTALTVADVRREAIFQIASWPDMLASIKRVLGEILGVAVPPLGHASVGPAAAILSLGPGRYLVTAPSSELRDRITAAITPADGSVTDLSHGRAILELAGAEAVAVLAKGLAVDLHLSAFPPGRVAQSVIHHIDVTVHRLEPDRFQLIVLRGFAEDFVEWLMDAGLEYGIAFAGPAG